MVFQHLYDTYMGEEVGSMACQLLLGYLMPNTVFSFKTLHGFK